MVNKRTIHLTVNDLPYEVAVEPRLTLVDLLRGELGLGGVHVGCEHGVCGACTVIMDGRAVRSCIMLAVQADGANLQTVEGLRGEGGLHLIQEVFMEAHGLQCGFCTPGFLMSALELLGENPDPSDEEITETLGGNICRCTGYQSIIEAVRLAASKMRETAPSGKMDGMSR